MAHVDTSAVPPRRVGAGPVVKVLAGVAILALGGFIAVQGESLYREFRSLREQQARTSQSAVVGYVDIHAEPNLAIRPDDWYHDEGGQTLLWAGWREGKHDWFRIGLGEVAREQVSLPMGRDVIRAIDHPILEDSSGPHWGKIPDSALVAGIWRGGTRVVYPLLVLSKVEVVNDTIGEEPVLVLYRPFVPEREAVAVFAPIVDGHRITMGLSGYLMNRTPVLYDRGTRSLWLQRDGSLAAIAGPLKGTALRAAEGIEILAWSDWRARYPESRLVVGADRKKARPEL
jgi:hypothetical protein